jgi:hypothetical protein
MLPDDVRAIALLLPEVVEGAHSGNRDFRVGGRVFATLWADEDRLVVKLTPEMQATFVEEQPDVFEPIEGSWGRRGSTNVDLGVADEEMVRAALLAAWTAAAPGLASRFEPI